MPPSQRHFTNQADIDAVVDLYASGYTIAEVKAMLCLDASLMTIQRVLKVDGGTRRTGYQRISTTCESCEKDFIGKAYNNKVCRRCVPDRSWEQRWSLYRIAKPQFKALWRKQSGLCAMCELPLPKSFEAIKIDHCHQQGHVRGLLHHKCNIGLHFIENDKFLAAAVRYIELHRK